MHDFLHQQFFKTAQMPLGTTCPAEPEQLNKASRILRHSPTRKLSSSCETLKSDKPGLVFHEPLAQIKKLQRLALLGEVGAFIHVLGFGSLGVRVEGLGLGV